MMTPRRLSLALLLSVMAVSARAARVPVTPIPESDPCGPGESRAEVVAAIEEAIDANEHRIAADARAGVEVAKDFVCRRVAEASGAGAPREGAEAAKMDAAACPEVKVTQSGVGSAGRDGASTLLPKAVLERGGDARRSFELRREPNGGYSLRPAWLGSDARGVSRKEFNEAFRGAVARHSGAHVKAGGSCVTCHREEHDAEPRDRRRDGDARRGGATPISGGSAVTGGKGP